MNLHDPTTPGSDSASTQTPLYRVSHCSQPLLYTRPWLNILTVFFLLLSAHSFVGFHSTASWQWNYKRWLWWHPCLRPYTQRAAWCHVSVLLFMWVTSWPWPVHTQVRYTDFIAFKKYCWIFKCSLSMALFLSLVCDKKFSDKSVFKCESLSDIGQTKVFLKF